ncbi:LexA family transcriptional regulator [Pseudomonas paracarnis]|uniref:LexA family transcriptional regulator n=1 Tax=Pseudomonas paracarnis TaxID=2750625 RepID=A0ABU6BV55_9PSED|nr:LexA family transcriptional regulator [Pseudomonas paracarnis]MBW9244123.1 LexA family transcriptional regulator [Pseudomonas paracarnis]MEB3783715.1 LexA family transcriptional regulator [Pseudomonas paracarnis]
MKKDSRRLPLSEWQLQDSARLKSLFQAKRGELKLTQEKLAADLGDGVTQGAVSHFMNGRTALSVNAAVVFARALGVPVSEISPTLAAQIEKMSEALPGKGSQQATDGRTPPRSFDLNDEPGYTGVLQLTARGSTGDGDDNPHVEIRGVMAFKSAWLRANNLNQKHLDVIYASGNSMEPTINDGDVLLVDESKIEPKDGQIFAMQSESKGTIVKRLVKSDFEGWIIRSDNPDKARYGDETLRDGEINEVRIIGRVVWRGGML